MFNVGSTVRVKSCAMCSALNGKFAVVKGVNEEGESRRYKLSFGKGRPQKGRPELFEEFELEASNE